MKDVAFRRTVDLTFNKPVSSATGLSSVDIHKNWIGAIELTVERSPLMASMLESDVTF